MDQTARLRDLFEHALALPVAARAAFLAAQCADAAQRGQLERMLAADAGDDELLAAGDAVAVAERIGDDELVPALPPGSRIGPFELIEVQAGRKGFPRRHRHLHAGQAGRRDLSAHA